MDHQSLMADLMSNLIEHPAKTIQELASNLKVTTEEVANVIDSLRYDMNCDIRYEDKKYHLINIGDYKVHEQNLSIKVNLTVNEIISLFFLKSRSTSFKGTKIDQLSEQAIKKISRYVPGVYDKFEDISSLFITLNKRNKQYNHRESKIFAKLMNAMLAQKSCKIHYYSFASEKVKKFTIDPLNFFEHQEGTYIFAKLTHTADKILTLAIERIEEITITENHYDRPKGFDPNSYLQLAFGIVDDEPFIVKLHINKSQAKYITERIWGAGQKISKNQDGSIILEFKTSGWFDVKRWILSFGENMKVIEPESMKKKIVYEYHNSINQYCKDEYLKHIKLRSLEVLNSVSKNKDIAFSKLYHWEVGTALRLFSKEWNNQTNIALLLKEEGGFRLQLYVDDFSSEKVDSLKNYIDQKKYSKYWIESKTIRCFGFFDSHDEDEIFAEFGELAKNINNFFHSEQRI